MICELINQRTIPTISELPGTSIQSKQLNMTSNPRQAQWQKQILSRTWSEEEIIVDFPSMEERAGRALNKNRKHSLSCDIIIVTPSDQKKLSSKTKPLETMDCENFNDRWHP
mmetsp:Transcript_22078/g.33125  ORF Transcript_22078/g.33125 Transcript_22078/m.33125 type:complete len:112 (-) Transcript_22078:216-551(-)